MDKELLKILVNLRIVEGLLSEATIEIKEVADRITEYIKKGLGE